MTDFTARKRALEAKITEVEATLSELKTELELETQREQHAAIDRLEDYLGELDTKHSSLQEFWRVLRDEVRGLISGDPDSKGQGDE